MPINIVIMLKLPNNFFTRWYKRMNIKESPTIWTVEGLHRQLLKFKTSAVAMRAVALMVHMLPASQYIIIDDCCVGFFPGYGK